MSKFGTSKSRVIPKICYTPLVERSVIGQATLCETNETGNVYHSQQCQSTGHSCTTVNQEFTNKISAVRPLIAQRTQKELNHTVHFKDKMD